MPVFANQVQSGPAKQIVRHQSLDGVIHTGSRKHGATQKQFQDFIRAADSGLRVEMHGQNYVAMSRNIYDELKRAANPITTTTGDVPYLTTEEREAIAKQTVNYPSIFKSPGGPRPTPNPTQALGGKRKGWFQ